MIALLCATLLCLSAPDTDSSWIGSPVTPWPKWKFTITLYNHTISIDGFDSERECREAKRVIARSHPDGLLTDCEESR